MNRFEWVSATSVEDAIEHLAAGAVGKAGGVDLLDQWKEGMVAPARVVNLRTIPGLDAIEETPKGLRIGAMATLASVAGAPVVRKRWPALAEATGRAATPNIRNMATIGGNLLQRPRCWYFRSQAFPCFTKGGEECFAVTGENQYHAIVDNELCAKVHPSSAAVPLMAYGAVLEIHGRAGRRDVPIESFFVHPTKQLLSEHSLAKDEILTAIRVPAPSPATRSSYMEMGEKESYDWALASVAAVLEMGGGVVRRAAVVLGAAAAVPLRASASEQYLAGKRLDAATAREAARLALRGATPLGRNEYKLALFETIVARTLLGAA